MNVPLTTDLKRWVDQKIKTGEYPSEEAVMVAALHALKGQEAIPALDELIDRDFVAYCEREADDSVTLEEVREATSKIRDSMTRVIIEEERADRF